MDKLINGRNWMSFCDSGLCISELLIPGTHDTMTASCQQRYYKTQHLSLEEQLSCGVRFLDIRLRQEMVAAHREWISHITFDQIIKNCHDFLQQNSKEFILMRIQNANENKDDFEAYGVSLLEKISQYASMFYFWTENELDMEGNPKWPRVEDVRGKIIALECSPVQFKFNHLENKFWAANWHCNPNIELQDLWDGPTIHQKQEAVEHLIQNSIRIPADKLILNHISATNGELGFPDLYAENLNPYTQIFWKSKQGIRGVQIYDFIDPSLSREVFMLNHSRMKSF